MGSVGIVVDRFLYFRKRKINFEELATSLSQCLNTNDLQAAKQLVEGQDILQCQVVEAGIMAYPRGPHATSEAMQSAKAKYKGKIDANLSILGTIGSNAPFIGLLGTVLGIIKAAGDLGSDPSKGGGGPGAVMAGVFEALVATAVGLGVAIPAIIFFNLFSRNIKATLSQVDSLSHLVLTHAEASHGKPAQKSAAGQPAVQRQAAAVQPGAVQPVQGAVQPVAAVQQVRGRVS
jgi:biopolymer transport protein ExbB